MRTQPTHNRSLYNILTLYIGSIVQSLYILTLYIGSIVQSLYNILTLYIGSIVQSLYILTLYIGSIVQSLYILTLYIGSIVQSSGLGQGVELEGGVTIKHCQYMLLVYIRITFNVNSITILGSIVNNTM